MFVSTSVAVRFGIIDAVSATICSEIVGGTINLDTNGQSKGKKNKYALHVRIPIESWSEENHLFNTPRNSDY